MVFSFVIPAVIMLLSTPYLLNEWTDNRFSIYTLGLSVLGFMNVFDLGLGRSLTQFIAKHKAQLSTEGWVLNHVLYIGVLMGLLGTGLIFFRIFLYAKVLGTEPNKKRADIMAFMVVASMSFNRNILYHTGLDRGSGKVSFFNYN